MEGFDYTTRIVLADGSRRKIGTIVNEKMPVVLLAYNLVSNKFEACEITHWLNFGQGNYFWSFAVTGGQRVASVPCNRPARSLYA